MTNQIEKITRTKTQQERANEMFDSLRDDLLKRDLSNTENYDKAILTLSAASLGLSLTAIRFIVPLETAGYTWLIITAWIFLLGSILTSLCAFLVSNKAIAIQLENAEDYYIKGTKEAFNRTSIFTKFNTVLNLATGLMFSIAITAIVTFVTININVEESIMSKKSNGKNTTINISKKATTNIRESTNIPKIHQVPTDTVVITGSTNIPKMQLAPESIPTSKGEKDNSNSSGSNTGGNAEKSK